jgi:hypothetical protein
MQELSGQGSYFVSRYNHRTDLYAEKDEKLVKFDLLKELRSAIVTGIDFCEYELYLLPNQKVRLIAEKAPDDVTE